MTDHAYVALIETPQQFDQVEDFVEALVRDGAGYANDIGVLEMGNHFPRGSLLVLFTADRGLIDACFHLEFGFDGEVHFEHLDAFETEGDEGGVEIIGFRSLADEAGEEADTPEQVFAHVRSVKAWRRGPRREAHADPAAYEEAADDWNRRLTEMLPVATARRPLPATKTRARPAKAAAKRSAAKRPAAKKGAAPRKPASRKGSASTKSAPKSARKTSGTAALNTRKATPQPAKRKPARARARAR